MEVHARWWCYDCQREWLQHSAAGAQPWTPEQGCPGCKSLRIEYRTYLPAFPGGDMPRGLPVVLDASVEPGASIVVVQQSAPIAMSDEDALAAQWEALGRT